MFSPLPSIRVSGLFRTSHAHAGVQPRDQWLPSSVVGRPLLPEPASLNVVLACLCGWGFCFCQLTTCCFEPTGDQSRLEVAISNCQYIIHWITLVFLDRGIAPLVWLGGINLAWPNLRFAGGRYDPTCRPGAPQNASHGCSQGFLITVSLSMGPFCLEVLGMKGKIKQRESHCCIGNKRQCLYQQIHWAAASKDFISVVILVSFLTVPIWNQDVVDQLDVIDLFAGRAQIAKLASWVGLRSRAYDINFCPVRHPMKLKRGKMRRSPMDLNGAAGLVLLGRETIIIPVYPWFFKLYYGFSHPTKITPYYGHLIWEPL